MDMIPFNKPCTTGNELTFVREVLANGKLAAEGVFSKKCNDFFSARFNFKNTFLTTSATAALEAITLLLELGPEDEIIIPSYTFVSSCNPFLLRGCKIIFADSQHNHPNIDHEKIESLITPKTKAIVVVHYAGMPCEMNKIMAIAKKYNIYVIEDAAHAIQSYYNGKPLGGIGHFGIISFHETKNITCGEGGLLIINDDQFTQRAEVIMEKGTNRAAFIKGEKQKYEWIDIGSSYGLSEINAAILWAQLQQLDRITEKRKEIWTIYDTALRPLSESGKFELPSRHLNNNSHIYYLVCKTEDERNRLCSFLKENEIQAAFHYLSLHNSPYFKNKYLGLPLNEAGKFTTRLLRIPLYDQLTDQDVNKIINCLLDFYAKY
jgi:dTDP-4-amino-4,6-dideoxygalactose transaminase